MAYNTKQIVTDVDGNPISQYYDPITDSYEPVEGSSGGNKVLVENNQGLSLIPILDKLSQLTGTVIDEETRKSNELQRIALYNNISNLLSTGQLKGDKGDTGNGLQFNWNGTQLGIRVEGQPTYTYVQLKGDKGDKGEKGETGDITSLNKSQVEGALGYTINESVPSGAKFTDTITTINGKTGEIAKADIVALGIPAQDTVYTHPAGTNPHGTTKSDVGLNNVTNDKQMPISGGILENYREKLTTVSASGGSINLSLGNVFQHSPSGNVTYSITNAVNGQAHSFTLIINMGSTVRTLTFPASVKWQGGEIPDLSTASKTYILTFVSINGGSTWLGMSGGEF